MHAGAQQQVIDPVTGPGTDPVTDDVSGVRVVRFDAPVEYRAAWARQRAELEAVASGEPPRLLMLEHEAVYTAGKRTQPHERPTDGTPVVDADRGGKITWHGPGQLVGYPIVALPRPVDVVAYVRLLERALAAACADLGLATTTIEGRSGVWVPGEAGRPDRKVAAIGIRVERGVTMHGFALNCDCDLSWADPIIPCGLPDAGVTSLTVELGRRVGVPEAVAAVTDRVTAAIEGLLSPRAA